MTLRIAPVSGDAARHAVLHWHYSKSMPCGNRICYGVWENGNFKGVVIFGQGANMFLGKPYGLTMFESCELVRVAIKEHKAPVSRIIAICIRLIKKSMPKMRLIISYADAAQGHYGSIYQAGNWIYVGISKKKEIVLNGRVQHNRTISDRYGTASIEWLRKNVDPLVCYQVAAHKRKYLMALDAQMMKQIKPLGKPYPKRATSIGADAPAHQAGEGCSQQTVALQSKTPAMVGDNA